MTTTGFLSPHATIQYSTNIELLLQQKGSKLRSKVKTGVHVGKQASPINQFGRIEAQAPAGRGSPMQVINPFADRRWVFPKDKEVPIIVDSFDLLRTIEDPKSSLVEDAAMAMGRAFDYEIISAANATANIGETGTGTESFDTTDFQVADNFGTSSASTGLTIKKLAEMKRKFRKAFVDLENEELTLVISSAQEADLINQAQVVSTDFGNLKVTVDEKGTPTRLMGFDIVVSEFLSTTAASDSGTDTVCLAFVKSGLYLGIWQDIMSRVDIRTDLSGTPWQVYSRATYGATRLQQGKVGTILCNNAL